TRGPRDCSTSTRTALGLQNRENPTLMPLSRSPRGRGSERAGGRRSHLRDDGHDHRPAAEFTPRPLADGAPHDLLQLPRRGLALVHRGFQGGADLREGRFEPGLLLGHPPGGDLGFGDDLAALAVADRYAPD